MRLVFLRFGNQEAKGGISTDDCTTESHIPDETVDVDRHPGKVIDRLPQCTDELTGLIMKRNRLVVGPIIAGLVWYVSQALETNIIAVPNTFRSTPRNRCHIFDTTPCIRSQP